jgi:catechol 2,3-dioxygenase-like lactoylglutathione lyase family enzyme
LRARPVRISFEPSQHNTIPLSVPLDRDQYPHPDMTTLLTAEPQLFVRDVVAAAEFYTRKLGFSVAFSYGEPPFYGQVFRDGARLNLRRVANGVVDPVRRDTDQLLAASIALDDAQPLFLEYQAAGVEFVQPLKSEPWGARTFIVRDPDGNLVLFAGPGEYSANRQ